MIKVALAFLKAGYSVIPVDENKQPLCDWQKYQSKGMTEAEATRLFKKAWGIALICSNGLEVLDFDLKYDLTGDMWYKFMQQVPEDLRKRLLINKTMNGGYHVIYKCDKTEGNIKLAQRPSTPEEKHVTYLRNYLKDTTRDKALKIAMQDKVRVLIETRGGVNGVGGGYIVVPPSGGYERVEGKGIYKITPEERDFLHNLAKSFDTYSEIKSEFIPKKSENTSDNDPFTDFNSRTDMLELMLSYGWTVVNENPSVARVKRPGDTKSKSSGLVNKRSNILKVFSTSHVLYNGDKGCSCAGVFIELECDGDKKLAYKKLVDMGYGIEG